MQNSEEKLPNQIQKQQKPTEQKQLPPEQKRAKEPEKRRLIINLSTTPAKPITPEQREQINRLPCYPAVRFQKQSNIYPVEIPRMTNFISPLSSNFYPPNSLVPLPLMNAKKTRTHYDASEKKIISDFILNAGGFEKMKTNWDELEKKLPGRNVGSIKSFVARSRKKYEQDMKSMAPREIVVSSIGETLTKLFKDEKKIESDVIIEKQLSAEQVRQKLKRKKKLRDNVQLGRRTHNLYRESQEQQKEFRKEMCNAMKIRQEIDREGLKSSTRFRNTAERELESISKTFAMLVGLMKREFDEDTKKRKRDQREEEEDEDEENRERKKRKFD